MRSASARALPWVAAGAAALLLVLGTAATRNGVSVTPDSVQYLSTAAHVAQGLGVRTSITDLTVPTPDMPFASWPPLYPAALAALRAAGLPPYAAARWFNVALLALAVFPLAWVALRAGGPRAAVFAVAAQAVLFYPVMLAAFAWSEPLYIALSLASLGFLAEGLRRDPERPGRDPVPRPTAAAPWFAAAGLLAGAAMLTRYIGFTLIGASVGGLWLLTLHRRPRAFWTGLLAYAIPALAPNAAWLLRNRLLTGTFFGPSRPEAWFGWDRILADTVRALSLDAAAPVARAGLPWTGLAAAGAAGALLLVLSLAPRLRQARFPSLDRGTGFTYLLWVYAGAFIAAMMILSRRVGFDPINTRYLAPAYPAILVLGTVAVQGLLAADRRRAPAPRARNALATALLLLALPQAAATTLFVARAGVEERTLTRPYWTSHLRDDPAWARAPGPARLLELADPARPVVSNVWDRIGLRTGLPAKPLPEPGAPHLAEALLAFPGALVAVEDGTRSNRAGAADLEPLAVAGGPLEPAGRAGGWTFYRVRPRDAAELRP